MRQARVGSIRGALLAAALLLGAAGMAAAQGAAVARLQTVAGTVSLVRGGAASPLARGGLELRIGDTVRTGPNGRARIVTVDGKRATLGPNASVTLGSPGRPNAWQQQAGRAAYWVTGKRRTEVSTPGAIAAAEGTGFELVVAEDGTSTLTVAEGAVAYYNEQGRVAVAANQQSVARPGQAPSRPIAVDASGIILFEGTIENLSLSIEPPRFFTPAPGASQQFGAVLTALAERRPDVAGPAVQTLAAGSPNSAESALASGLFLLAQGRAAEASPHLARCASLAAQSPEGPTYQGAALFRQGKLPEAEAALREAIRREPQAYAAHAYLSSVLLASGSPGDAEASARRATTLQPNSALAHEALGTVYLFSGRPVEAARELRQATELNPLSAGANLQLAKALAASDDLEGALEVASRSVAMDPGDASARVTLGVLFMADKDADRAEREFRYALKLAPDMAAARTGLGSVALQRGRFAQALREQKGALALDEGSAQALNNLGVALTARGALHEAVAELERAVRLQPQYAVAHANLAIAYLELNQYAKALDAAHRAVELGDRSAFVHTTLARVYLKQRRFDRALAELRRAEFVDRLYPLQHFFLSELYRIQGRDRDSLRSLFRGITLDPGTMVEQRLYARTETTTLGGTRDTFQRSAKTDGRELEGKLSYFASNASLQNDGPRRNDDTSLDFSEGILGYQPGPRLNLLFFGTLIDEEAGRPGRRTPTGPETPLFRHDLNGTNAQVMSRWEMRRGSAMTVNLGYRRLSILGEDPLETFTFRDFRNREASLFGEGRWDLRAGERDTLVSGVAFVHNERRFDGMFRLVPSGVARVRDDSSPGLLLGYAEWRRRVDDRTDFSIGPYAGGQAGAPNVILPKFVGRHQTPDGTTLALLAYPEFQLRAGDLRPVETWARPFDIARLGQEDGGYLMSYELTAQKPWARSSLLTATGFYRKGHRLLIPVVDPERAALASRAFFPRAELFGGELSYERYLTDGLTARLFSRFQQTRSLQGGAELPFFPRWFTGLRFDYVNTAGVRSFVGLNYTGSRRSIAFAGGPGRRLGGFVTVDIRSELQLDTRRNLFVEVRDLLDRGAQFFDGFPTNGRTFFGGIDHRF